MRIILGHSLDGGAHTPTPKSCASAGEIFAGPGRMTGILETFLGLPPIRESSIIRILQYESVLRTVDNGKKFFSESFCIDPRGVAMQILSLRDEVLMNARPDLSLTSLAGSSERLSVLAKIEAAATDVSPGYPDRLRLVLSELKRRKITVPITNVSLTEPAETWPALWRAIFTELTAQGCVFDEYEMSSPSCTGDLLAAKQAFCHGAKRKMPAKADGSLLLIEANNPLEEADITALLSRELSKNDEPVVIVAGEETDVLHSAFARIDAPAPGGSLSSFGLDALQILPLRCALAWRPADPRVLQQYLSLSVSPIARRLRRKLLEIVSRTGSIGGTEWTGIVAEHLDSTEPEKREDTKARIDQWLHIAYVKADASMDVKALDTLCGVFTDWAQKRAFVDDTVDRGLVVAMEQARAMRDACRIIGKSGLGRQELKALLRDITTTLPTVDTLTREKGSVRAVDSPGAILALADSVIWWNAGERSLESLPRRFWTRAEEAELAKLGVTLPDAATSLTRQRAEWGRAISSAAKRLIFVYSRAHGDERQPDEVHPIWHELAAAFDTDDVARLVIPASEALHGKPLSFIKKNVTAHVTASAPGEFPAFHPEWKIKPALLKDREKHSASSISQLTACTIAYVCGYLGKLRPSDTLTVSEGSQLNGNIAHDIIEQFLLTCTPWPEKKTIAKKVRSIFRDYIEQQGAILNMSGMDKERADLESHIVRACEQLVACLSAGGYEVSGIEEEHEANTALGPMKGFCDLVVKKPGSSKRAVIDLKWSSRDRHYEELSNGTAIQLAVYSELLSHAPTAYFIINRAEMLTVHRDVFPGATVIGGPTEKVVWSTVVEAVEGRRRSLASGTAAIGIPEETAAEPDLLYAPCKFCELDLFCGIGRQS